MGWFDFNDKFEMLEVVGYWLILCGIDDVYYDCDYYEEVVGLFDGEVDFNIGVIYVLYFKIFDVMVSDGMDIVFVGYIYGG